MCNPAEKFGHNFAGGICQVCKKLQREPMKKFIPVNSFANYRFRKKESPNSGHQLASDIIREIGGTYPMYMKIINLVGEQLVREWFSECKQAPPKFSRIALFLSTYKKFMAGVVWEEEK